MTSYGVALFVALEMAREDSQRTERKNRVPLLSDEESFRVEQP